MQIFLYFEGYLKCFGIFKKICDIYKCLGLFYLQFYDAVFLKRVLILFCVNFPGQRFPLWLIESKNDGNGKDNTRKQWSDWLNKKE